MRIARFSYASDNGPQVTFGVVDDGDGPGNEHVSAIDGHPFTPFEVTGPRYPISAVRLLPPVIPSKVVAVGRNYAEHAAEFGHELDKEAVIFLKPSTAVIGPGDLIGYPPQSSRVDYEGELAVVIGALCRDVPPERLGEVVLGYTCANDVTARDLQQSDGQWTRGKGFDSFCPLGPWIETNLDPADVALETRLNGEVKQQTRTSAMVRDVATLVSFVSSVMTLLPGDIILTGTPAGVGPMQPGDEVSVTVEGIGTLTNRVAARK